jgi:hypothetical protein
LKDRIALIICLSSLISSLNYGGEIITAQGDSNMAKNNMFAQIGPNGIVMPLGKIMIIRKGAECCAIKFTKIWKGKTEDDENAEYELYKMRPEKNSSEKILTPSKHTLSSSRLYGIGRLSFSFGKKDIDCGSFKLWWGGGGSVYFFSSGQDQGDYGVELSPTNLSNFELVNTQSAKLTWYSFDSNRSRHSLPLEGIE